MSLLPTAPSTGGNVVVPRSHRRFREIAERYYDPNPGFIGKTRFPKPRLNYRSIARKEPSTFHGALTAHLEAWR